MLNAARGLQSRAALHQSAMGSQQYHRLPHRSAPTERAPLQQPLTPLERHVMEARLALSSLPRGFTAPQRSRIPQEGAPTAGGGAKKDTLTGGVVRGCTGEGPL